MVTYVSLRLSVRGDNMQIDSRTSTERIETVIDALKEMLQEYEDGVHDPDNCSLCAISLWNGGSCRTCPWVWFTGSTCNDFYENRGHYGPRLVLNQVSGDSIPDIVKERMEQIQVWIDELQEYLQRRKREIQ